MVPVKVCNTDRFSRQDKSFGEEEVKFHRLRAAYVAVGGRPRCAETSKNGTEIAAGKICDQSIWHTAMLLWAENTYLGWEIALPNVSMCHEGEQQVRSLPLSF